MKDDAKGTNGGRANCIYGVCCFTMEERIKALAADLQRDLALTSSNAERVATYCLKHYDLAPPGSLAPLYTEIARLAREGYVKADA